MSICLHRANGWLFAGHKHRVEWLLQRPKQLAKAKIFPLGPLPKKPANSCSRTQIPRLLQGFRSIPYTQAQEGCWSEEKKGITAAIQPVLKIKEMT